MSRMSYRGYQPALLIILVAMSVWPAIGQEGEATARRGLLLPLGEEAARLNARPYRGRDFSALAELGVPAEEDRRNRVGRPKLDLSPFVGEFLSFLRRHGI